MSGAIRYRMPDALENMPVRGRFVVEASAGTGKTYLIEHRVLQLVAKGAPIDSILVVTFTEKATAELRGRIRQILARARGACEHDAAEDEPHLLIDDDTRRRLQDALFAADTAPIFTIHGFCQRVLTENAFSSRRLFEQTHVAAQTAFAGAFRAALREVFATDPDYLPFLRAYLGSGSSVFDLEELLFRIEQQQPGELRPAFDARAIEDAAAEALAAIQGAGAGDGVSAACKELKVHPSTRKSIGGKLDELADLLGRIGGSAVELAGALDRDIRKKLAYLVEKLPTHGDQTLTRVSTAIHRLQADVCSIETAVAHKLLPEVQRRVRRDKDSRGELDFGDLLNLVWESLQGGDGPALASRLRRRYPHALIDEFQDTDPTQWAIFRRLYLEADSGGSLAIIGDPKQAIYGFRGADVTTYLRACREVVRADGKVVRLPANYRSTPAVVDAYNRLVTDDGTGPFFTGGIHYDEPVTAARSLRATRGGDEVAPACVFRLCQTGERDPDARTIRAALARRIAVEIQALLGPRPLLVEGEGEPRAVDAGDIFVLTRSRRESDEIAAELRRAGVPCALYQQAGLFASAEATEVLELLLGIAEPERQAARFRAWQTRFFDVPLSDLPALASLEDTHPLVTTLHDWRALAATHRYDELFSSILTQSGVIERELFTETSERSVTNFLHIFELLLAEVGRSRCSIHELAQRLKTWQRAAEEETSADTDVQRLESERRAVQIMTVHKSKGLEAHVVFLYGACSERPSSGSVHVYREEDRRIIHVGPLDDDAGTRVGEEAAAEDQRLLYVALTRAAARLYLPLYPESKGTYAQLNDRLARIADRVASEHKLAAAFEVEDVAIETPRESTGSEVVDDPLAGWRPPAPLLALPEPAVAGVAPARRGFIMTSYTRMKRAEQALEPIHDADFKVDATVAPIELAPTELSPGAASGIFLHEILESLDVATVREERDFDAWREREDVRDLFSKAIARHDRDPGHRRHSESMVYRALTTPVHALDMPCLAARDRDLRELEFLYPIPGRGDGGFGDRGFIKGFIDFVFEWRGRTYLLDWKSDVLTDYDAEAVRAYAEATYSLQARIYALALIKMLGIRDERDHERRFGGIVYWFLRGAAEDGSGIYTTRPRFDELQAAEAALAAMEVS